MKNKAKSAGSARLEEIGLLLIWGLVFGAYLYGTRGLYMNLPLLSESILSGLIIFTALCLGSLAKKRDKNLLDRTLIEISKEDKGLIKLAVKEPEHKSTL